MRPAATYLTLCLYIVHRSNLKLFAALVAAARFAPYFLHGLQSMSSKSS